MWHGATTLKLISMEKQVLKMPLSYFFKAGTNGNLSLSSITQRVEDASQVFKSDVVIELDNGVRCSSREELLVAVSQANIDSFEKPKQQNTSPESSSIIVSEKSDNKMSAAGIIVVVFVIGIFFLILIWILNWYLY